MATARILITEPNGVKRSRPISGSSVSIGRGEDNDVVVNYASVSRRHAQVDCDGHQFYVTDLESGNGTFLGNQRIQPGAPTPWRPGVPLHIGEARLDLEQITKTDSWSGTYSGVTPDQLRAMSGQEKGGGAGKWLLLSLAAVVVLTLIVLVIYYVAFYQ